MMMFPTLVFVVATISSCSACPTHCNCYFPGPRVVCRTPGKYSSFQQLVRELPSGTIILTVESQFFERLDPIAVDVAKVSNLVQLDITYSQVRNFDANFFTAFPRLHTLSLSYNDLSIIPSGAFSNLKSLVSLFLANNALRVVSEGLLTGLDSLVTLDLDGNGLLDIDTHAFTDLSKLLILKLRRNNLRDVVSTMNVLFNPGSSVQRLYLDSNGITRVPEGWVNNLPNLNFISLNNNSIASIHPRAFDTSNGMKQLFLNGNKLSAIEFPLQNALVYLETFEISGNQLSQLQGTELHNLFSLKRLDMSKNKLKSLLNKTFKDTYLLETIILSSNELVSVQSGLFRDLNRLRVLDLRYNPLCPSIQQTAQLSTNPQTVFTEIERCAGCTIKTTQVSASVTSIVPTSPSVSPVSDTVTSSGTGKTTVTNSWPERTTTVAMRKNEEEDDNGENKSLIVGTVLGVVGFLVVVAFVAYCCVRQNKRAVKFQTSKDTAVLSEADKANQEEEYSNQVSCKDADAVAIKQMMPNRPRKQEDSFLAPGHMYASVDDPEAPVRYSAPPSKDKLYEGLQLSHHPSPTYKKMPRSPTSFSDKAEGQYQDLTDNRGGSNLYRGIGSEMYATPPWNDNSGPVPPNERVSTATYDYIAHPDENGYFEPVN